MIERCDMSNAENIAQTLDNDMVFRLPLSPSSLFCPNGEPGHKKWPGQGPSGEACGGQLGNPNGGTRYFPFETLASSDAACSPWSPNFWLTTHCSSGTAFGV